MIRGDVSTLNILDDGEKENGLVWSGASFYFGGFKVREFVEIEGKWFCWHGVSNIGNDEETVLCFLYIGF